MKMKRIAVLAGAVVLAALLAAHVVYWYLPRERAVVPRLGAGGGAALPAAGAAGGSAGGAAGEPLQVLSAGAYDVCVWVPYPHQNLGALAAAIGDLQDVVGAAARLSSGEGGEASAARPREAEEAPTFGPFEVPPASELVACSDLAGGRLRVVARIYPALAVVAKLAGRVAGNPWLAGGVAGGSTRISWQGRLWTVIAGQEEPRTTKVPPGTAAPPAVPEAVAAAAPELPESLAVVHWTGARPEIPAGYYALTRNGSDLALSLVAAGGGGGAGPASAPPGVPGVAGVPGVSGPLPSLLVAVGPDWRGVEPFAAGPGSAAASRGGPVVSGAGGLGGAAEAARPPAALALFETSGSHLSTLGDLPGLAVFNAAPPGAAPGPVRWRLPTEGFFRLLAGRLPAADLAGWRILALDSGSLRQAEALAPRLAALVPPVPAGATVPAGASVRVGPSSPVGASVPVIPAAAVPTVAAPSGATGRAALSLGIWLEPRSTLGIVTRIRRFVEKFPLASRRQVDLWRDWETVLDPLANCDHAALAATASPPSMRLLLRGCKISSPPR
ncbi:MAG TPA: hypothetical protein VOA80_02390 [Thermoanaerobaculia bacterium]|nr:hypothetical protein [Thermoanaerobaculia bacterium]